tara:strand:+ start:3127 stop:3672 length:546 start_codon:yes stop_codon:yes gene_type:complete
MNQVAKSFLRTAGGQLGGYLDKALNIGGKVGQDAATAALNYGVQRFAPKLAGKVGKEVPRLLRNNPSSVVPQVGKLAGQAAVIGTGFAAANMLDQQSEYSQPMTTGLGNSEVQSFLQQQQLQNQKFMHDMALVQARAESRIPGAQYPGSLYGGMGDRAFEKSILDEVGVFGRGLYGTGLRA